MAQDPDQTVPAPDGGSAPLDDTQPVEVPRFVPTPDPRPDTRWAWAAPERTPDSSPWAAPSAVAGTPSGGRPADGGVPWSAPAPSGSAGASWAAPASSATATWVPTGSASGEGGIAAAAPALAWDATPAQAAPLQRRSGPGVGTVAAVALLSAVLASSGTALALNATGAFSQPAPAPVPVASPAAVAPGGGSSTTTDESSAVITSSAHVSPSVVKITVQGSSSDPFAGGDTSGVGSGIIYDPSGWIVTNHHVVTGANTLTVELKDGRTFSGTVYGIDTLTDLAIVKVDATGLPAASLGSSDGLKVGQLVVAVGSPLGTYSFSVTSGIVSGKGRSIIVSDGSTISNLIQTDAAINPGNSGGPLADAEGNVVGINTAIADGSNGIGFAIPIDIAKPIMAQAVKGEKLERPWIGIRYETIDQKVKAAENLSVDNGALVINGSTSGGTAIQPNSPAEAAGLQDGDIITAINGIAVDQEHPLNLLLVQFAPKDTVQLTVIRGGQTITVPLTLGVRPDNLQ